MGQDANFALYGRNLFGDIIKPKTKGVLFDEFIFPPFSVLNARDGYWQDRKRRWNSLGIKSEIGRGDELCYKTASANYDHCRVKEGTRKTTERQGYTSIFDPVLCELMYTWFCPKSGQILDPFSGGSVRGITASILGYKYWGCDLSKEQIVANIEQAKKIINSREGNQPMPEFILGDALDKVIDAPRADFIFTCPPYGDLEKYTNDPKDLSNMELNEFINTYKRIIMNTCKRLKQDRFACFVVGDYRDKNGMYRNFVSKTIEGFVDCGLYLYNEAILVTCVGSASIRAKRQFDSGRKLAKSHQNVLIFLKGDSKKAANCIRNKLPGVV